MSDSGNTRTRVHVKWRISFTLAVMLSLAATSNSSSKPQSPDVLPECGRLPSCINSQSGRGAQASEPVRANAGQWQILKAWIARQKDREITLDDGNFIQAIVKTTLMKFREDIQLLSLPDDQLIQARSSSRPGLSDPAANARRVETPRDQLKPWARRCQFSGRYLQTAHTKWIRSPTFHDTGNSNAQGVIL